MKRKLLSHQGFQPGNPGCRRSPAELEAQYRQEQQELEEKRHQLVVEAATLAEENRRLQVTLLDRLLLPQKPLCNGIWQLAANRLCSICSWQYIGRQV